MDKSLELYLEENRQQAIQLKQSIDSLITIFSGKIDVGFTPTEKVKIAGEVKVNTQDTVKVSNIGDVVKGLEDLSTKLEQTIKDNAHKPVDTVTVANIDEAKTEEVTIKNWDDLKDFINSIGKAIESNQPIVNVTKQEVIFPTDPQKPMAVRLSDGKSFYKAVQAAFAGGMSTAGLATEAKQDDIITAIEGIGGATKYVTLIDETTTTDVTYIGKAVPTGSAINTSSSVWQITKIDESSGTVITYADGDLLFNNIWDNRASLTYA